MINGLTLWGNCHLIPRGPLREPLNALRRADAAVLHHADLVYKLTFISRLKKWFKSYMPRAPSVTLCMLARESH